MSEPVLVRPIGVVVGGHLTVADDYQGGVESIIRIHEQYPLETLQGLEEFSHLLVTWQFNRASPGDVHLHTRSPRNDPRWAPTGTFAHRNHRRPNQLATSFPRLLRVDGRDLHVTDLDAVDGTPVIDLGPYFPQMGPRGEIRQPDWPAELLTHYWADAADRAPE
ncbi:SAM-dependent methyltransferase [Kitasatospora sp. NPDC096128]|uniref:SAM-dependent methyltransferase n=1 Tax=Kitasatospora sp. NPDC096128 TaxID=3155547 RepID=UPI003320D17A